MAIFRGRRSATAGFLRHTAAFAAALCLGLLALLLSPAGYASERPAVVLLDSVFPGATHFGSMEGEPPAIPAYRNNDVVGYLFRTHAVVQSLGLSGKKLDILAGIDMDGIITGAAIVEHHEPILAIGVSSQDLDNFVASFAGRNVRNPVKVVRRARKDPDAIDAVSGATVSSLLMSDAIYQSAKAVGQSRGILEYDGSGLDLTAFEETDWPALVKEGSIVSLRLTLKDAEMPFLAKGIRLYEPAAGSDPDSLFIELWVGLATPARTGRNLLGVQWYNRLAAGLDEGEHLIFIAANGRYSFKGTSYIKTGNFDRIQIVQGPNTFTFPRENHSRIEKLRIAGAPEFRETALFTLPAGSGFNPARPWRLELAVAAPDAQGTPLLTSHSLTYAIPRRYLPAASVTPITPPSDALWKNVWLDRLPDVVFLLAMLGCLGAVFFLQDLVAQRRKFYLGLRYGFLTVTLLWLGWYSAAQLSVLTC